MLQMLQCIANGEPCLRFVSFLSLLVQRVKQNVYRFLLAFGGGKTAVLGIRVKETTKETKGVL